MKRDEKKSAARERLLQAALKLFRRDGYEAVSVRQIAAEAEMSTGAIFSHFNDKADLFRAATGDEPPNVKAFLDEVVAREGEHAGAAALLRQALYGL